MKPSAAYEIIGLTLLLPVKLIFMVINHEDNNNNTHLRTALSTSVGLCKQKEEEEESGEETE